MSKPYEYCGQFTPLQRKWAKEISDRIKKLRASGCVVIGKQDYLEAYVADEYDNSTEYNTPYPTPSLECGRINDSGADDQLYLNEDYITPF